MNLLAIDTSTEIASVALTTKGGILSTEQSGVRQHALVLLPMIERLLSEAELPLNQLDALVYGRGPGSFTGIRIACSVAKGLAYAHDLPLLPVSSLAAIASDALEQSSKEGTRVLAMLDARMNQVYWACFTEGMQDTEEYVSAAQDVVFTSNDDFILAGTGYESYLDQLPVKTKLKITSYFSGFPQASAMIRLALSGKISKVSAAEAQPVYIRNQITQGDTRG